MKNKRELFTYIIIFFSFFPCYREFHYGPDPTLNQDTNEVKVTTPPESTFKKLAPSKNRYTLLRDEL